jgi:hypothetical protein
MFWTTLKWGATAALVVVLCLALWKASPSGDEMPQGGQAPPQQDNPPPKKFNF